mgnify:FL=1
MKFFKKLSRSVKGRVAIITGAGSGMGEATAKVFASEGVKVLATDINLEGVKRVSEEIRSDKGECTPLLLDVTDKSAIDNCIEEALRIYNGIDFIINNAGIS